ncbi:MAG: hypothetical protein QF489_10620 [Planctomycetota bacterium]|jgi:hypothetical protein|nr:hypothetical protein [Planctomycetota bacterium]
MLSALLLAASLGLPAQNDTATTIQTIYVVEFCHSDIGFDAPPSQMAQNNHDRMVDALNLMNSWPDFHWTVETTHQLEGFLQRASDFDRMRFQNRLNQGRIALGSNYTNVHSANVGEEQLNRLTYAAAKYDSLFNTQTKTAFLCDVPGFSNATPRVLASAGFPNAVLCPNNFIGGEPEIPLGDRPFWWEASDGSRTLTWQTYGSYAEGYVNWGLLGLADAERRIPLRLAEYHAAGYTYDAIMVTRAFDNIYPNSGMANLAAQWNAAHATPKIKLATADEFFEHMRSTYGNAFPVYRGDGSGHWDDVTTVTPASTAIVRRARAGMADLEALRSAMLHRHAMSYPLAQLNRAWRRLLVFDEHSGGGVGWPGHLTLAEVEQENAEFVQIALDAEHIFTENLEQALELDGPLVVPSGEAGLVLYNPLGEAYSGIVEVDTGSSQPTDLRLAAPNGGADAVFRWLDNQRRTIAIQVDLPAYGWSRWEILGGGTTPPPPTWTAGHSLTTGPFSFFLDPATGVATQWLDNRNGIDWLQNTSAYPFAGVEAGSNQRIFFGQGYPQVVPMGGIEVESAGPLFTRLRVLEPNGQNWSREYRVYEDEARVDVLFRFRRSDLPYVTFDKHSIHYGMSFPADLTPPTELIIDGADGHYRPGPDSLPGVQLAHFGASTGATLVGAQGRWISVSSLDTPSLDLDGMSSAPTTTANTDATALTWKLIRHHSEGQMLGGAIRKVEIEPGLPDLLQYHFKVRVGENPLAAPNRETQRRDLQPPFATWVSQGQGNSSTVSGTFLNVSGPVMVTAMKRAEDDSGTIVRLRADEVGGAVTITPPFSWSSAWACDLAERPHTALPPTSATIFLTVAPNEVATILIYD